MCAICSELTVYCNLAAKLRDYAFPKDEPNIIKCFRSEAWVYFPLFSISTKHPLAGLWKCWDYISWRIEPHRFIKDISPTLLKKEQVASLVRLIYIYKFDYECHVKDNTDSPHLKSICLVIIWMKANYVRSVELQNSCGHVIVILTLGNWFSVMIFGVSWSHDCSLWPSLPDKQNQWESWQKIAGCSNYAGFA